MTVIQTSERQYKQIPGELVRRPPKPTLEIFENADVLVATVKNPGFSNPS